MPMLLARRNVGTSFLPVLTFAMILLQQYATHTKATRMPVPIHIHIPIPVCFFLSAIRGPLQPVLPDHR